MQQVDRYAGGGVRLLPGIRRDVDVDAAAEAVLRRENCRDASPALEQPVQVTPALGVDTRLIGHQADPAVADQAQTVGEQHLDPGTHLEPEQRRAPAERRSRCNIPTVPARREICAIQVPRAS